jgi:nitrile hydratase accessory protein
MRPDLRALLARADALPPDRQGPTFRVPWHAQAFALAVALNGAGHFSWPEWAETLAATLRDPPAGDDAEDAYYLAWLATLERLAIEKGLISDPERQAREAAWDQAARSTPHGRPITLGPPDRGQNSLVARDVGSARRQTRGG